MNAQRKLIFNIFKMMKNCSLVIFFLVLNSIQISAQLDSNKISKAASYTNKVVSDSSTVDSLSKNKKYDIDQIIYSSASDSIFFNLKNKEMLIFGTGKLKYKETNLNSGRITVDFEKNLLHARGIIDTSAKSGKKFKETPILSEGSEKYMGDSLRYNYKTQQGYISEAEQDQGDAKYKGEAVKKVSKNIYFIKNGIYTTCDGNPPDTYFAASEMKVIQNDKIIARWIFMYIAGVPLPIPLPFAVFPNKSGRRSGIIVPAYGEDISRGQYFRNFGYFWAISDYMDLALTGDYYLKGGFGLRSRFRYVKRYNYNGNLNLGYSRIKTGEANDPDRTNGTEWNISLNHNQTFNPTTRLDLRLSFQSSKYLSNNSINLNDQLRKNIISNATFSKRWDESGNSLSLSYSRIQNLQTGNITETLPDLKFSKIMSYPFREKGKTGTKNMKWYEYIGYNYSGLFKNIRKKEGGNLKIRGGIQHNFSINASPKIGYFSISPRISYNEKWYNKQIEKSTVLIKDPTTGSTRIYKLNNLEDKDSVITNDVHKIGMVRNFSLGVSASTKLYGTFQPNILGIEAFRHTITPSISYNYRPDFSKNFWGYYKSLKRLDGTTLRYDPYEREIFGGAGSGESQSINLSVGNIFEMKTIKDPADTTSKQKKITLLNLNVSTGYNFAADSLKLSNLRLSYRTQIGNLLNFSGSSSYTFYDYNKKNKINTFLASAGKGLFRIQNLNFSISASISGDKIAGEKRNGKENQDSTKDYQSFGKSDYISLYEDENADFTIPWNLSLAYNYNFQKPTTDAGKVNSNLGLNLGFNLTKNWKFTVRGNYDFQRNEISAPQITIYRDLKCWEMNFTWNPLGTYSGFRLELRMKAPQLKDIKVTRTKGLYTGR